MSRKLTKAEKAMFAEFMEEFPYCMACGIDPRCFWPVDRPRYPRMLENHHILGGANREHDRRNLARLCKLCHDLAGGAAIRATPDLALPGAKVGQLLPTLRLDNIIWIKYKTDPKYYDRSYLKALRGRLVPNARQAPLWFRVQFSAQKPVARI